MQGSKKCTDGFSDSSSIGSVLDDADREVSSLTDRAFRSLCISEDASFHDSDLALSPDITRQVFGNLHQGTEQFPENDALDMPVDPSKHYDPPFNISKLLTPIIPTKHVPESSDSQPVETTPSPPGQLNGYQEKEPSECQSRDSYKSKAPSLLFNLKDVRKRVKSTYSPSPLLKGLDEKARGQQDSLSNGVLLPNGLEESPPDELCKERSAEAPSVSLVSTQKDPSVASVDNNLTLTSPSATTKAPFCVNGEAADRNGYEKDDANGESEMGTSRPGWCPDSRERHPRKHLSLKLCRGDSEVAKALENPKTLGLENGFLRSISQETEPEREVGLQNPNFNQKFSPGPLSPEEEDVFYSDTQSDFMPGLKSRAKFSTSSSDQSFASFEDQQKMWFTESQREDRRNDVSAGDSQKDEQEKVMEEAELHYCPLNSGHTRVEELSKRQSAGPPGRRLVPGEMAVSPNASSLEENSVCSPATSSIWDNASQAPSELSLLPGEPPRSSPWASPGPGRVARREDLTHAFTWEAGSDPQLEPSAEDLRTLSPRGSLLDVATSSAGLREKPGPPTQLDRAAGKPPAVPPKTEKALRRAKKLASKRRKIDQLQEKHGERREERLHPEDSEHRPPSPGEKPQPRFPVVRSLPPPTHRHSVSAFSEPVRRRPGGSQSLTPLPAFPATQKVLQDPQSGEYFVFDLPLQVKIKTFYDPETGKYVKVSIPASERGSPEPTTPDVLAAPYVLYPGFRPLPMTALMPLRCSSQLSAPTFLRQPPHTTEAVGPRPRSAHDAALQLASEPPGDPTQHSAGQRPEGPPQSPGEDEEDAPSLGIISTNDLEDFATEGIS
ncbi:Cardiac-enriched FHL2-interacting protein [Camelus dromedarius]|uniref:Cardiac-enriched FHL2-interacting protein n=1 Tax=Camelus dromedarius TaxID=9838 RepID=A0A5N4DIQ8_CAMDR|nr:Cardiac-enriched FHL2-interacting protein [Camelus dromedarius]